MCVAKCEGCGKPIFKCECNELDEYDELYFDERFDEDNKQPDIDTGD